MSSLEIEDKKGWRKETFRGHYGGHWSITHGKAWRDENGSEDGRAMAV